MLARLLQGQWMPRLVGFVVVAAVIAGLFGLWLGVEQRSRDLESQVLVEQLACVTDAVAEFEQPADQWVEDLAFVFDGLLTPGVELEDLTVELEALSESSAELQGRDRRADVIAARCPASS